MPKSRKGKEKRLLKYLPQAARHEVARLQCVSRARSESMWREGVGGDRMRLEKHSHPILPAKP